MTSGISQRVRSGFMLAHLLTGNEEAALASLRTAVGEFLRHPSSDDAHEGERVFLGILRRRCLDTPARSELRGALAELHRAVEPGRSLAAMEALAIADARTAASAIGVPSGTTRPPFAADAEVIATLLPSEAAALQLESIEHALAGGHPKARRFLRSPSTIAVLLALVVFGIVVASGGLDLFRAFPDEAVAIATQAAKADMDAFSPVETKLENVPDWFALKGHDGVRIPSGFGRLDAVGVRQFRYESEPVAQIAALDGETRLFILAFPGRPFGVQLRPGEWRFRTAGRYALALCQLDGTCFLIALPGDRETLAQLVKRMTTAQPRVTD